MKTHMKLTENWYFEWHLLSKYERALICIDLVLPTPKDKSFCFGMTIFTLSLFYIEIAYVGNDKKIERNHYDSILF